MISVIMPSHNSDITLDRAVRSVLSQTYKNLELIIVDNGSVKLPKLSDDILMDPRVKMLVYAEVLGAAKARNVGVREASGEYVAFSGYQVVGAYPEKMYSAPQLIIVARGVGGCGDIKYTPSNCFLTNLSIAIQTEQIAIEDYLYHYLRLHNTKMMNTGSAQPQITVSTLEKYQLPIPAQELLESFSVFAQPFKNLYRKNREENERLASIRDMLLPQLMSGELDVSEIDL